MILKISELKHLASVAPEGYKKIKSLRDELLQLKGTLDDTDSVDIQEKKTIQYMLDELEQAVITLKTIKKFVVSHKLALTNPMNDKTRAQLTTMLEHHLSEASKIDFKQINIAGANSYIAAQALLSLFDTLNTLLPHDDIKYTRKTLNQKIAHFQKKNADIISPASITNFLELNQYIKHALQAISIETEGHVKFEHYQALKLFTQEKSEALLIQSIQKKSISQKDYGETFQLLDKMTLKIAHEKNDIIKKFDMLTETFSQKIDELRTRSTSTHAMHSKKTYKPAIQHAEKLLQDLKKAKNKFRQSGNLPCFQKTIHKLLSQFEGERFFKIHRSVQWFQDYIQKPFEQFKKEMNFLIDFFNINIEHFEPAKTNTTEIFEAYKNNIENLIEEQAPPTPHHSK
ncbi:MAG: hypothetical protein P1U61_04135 [Legionellaceae bacterium]|nr:hypothetical protein [Legionellaceae bacterium]